jgi:hypothetical protein
MKILPTLVSLFAATLALAACAKPETTLIGKTYPDRGVNCEVVVLPDNPTRGVENIATTAAKCHMWKGRSACIEKLKAEACRVGADLVYGFREGRTGKDGEFHLITATLALARAAAPTSAPTSGSGDEQPQDACNPPCSPGYLCQAGSCQAQCNPPCSPGYACGQDRTCKAESTNATASAPSHD